MLEQPHVDAVLAAVSVIADPTTRELLRQVALAVNASVMQVHAQQFLARLDATKAEEVLAPPAARAPETVEELEQLAVPSGEPVAATVPESFKLLDRMLSYGADAEDEGTYVFTDAEVEHVINFVADLEQLAAAEPDTLAARPALLDHEIRALVRVFEIAVHRFHQEDATLDQIATLKQLEQRVFAALGMPKPQTVHLDS